MENEVATLIIDTLNLRVDPSSIDPQAPLFNEGLGLDSIDALELAMSISKKYGFQLRSNDENNANIFASLSSLSRHIESSRTT
ncbi:MAG: acyl carrier protein [gamma proteobacterium endosymbiont of Lamellibrachia anaximandri]|nr:acyl carrier protein [gamma proteobacterium endosymbiont of Lamellibrachia anaximandri]MBL3534694.1 acyl carrier protein [gamma proteobacterium endosymbiont of Lamellibrachia anaximandri]MBL3600621.1 acyl carrier protein [gamma proteobacterium endosymbiont of Lamellibrachia anaximandri]